MKRAKALTKYVRVSPRKARLVADLIRGLSVEEATLQLLYSPNKSGLLLKKTLDSAVANGETQHDMRREKMFIDEIRVNEGPTMKRAWSRSRGSRSPIFKRTSHFEIYVKEGE